VRRLLVCIVVALTTALVGPRLLGPQGRPAGEPFAYEPPEGFVPLEGATLEPLQDDAPPRVWVHPEPVDMRTTHDRSKAVVRVVLHHSRQQMSVEEPDLAKLVGEMAKAFEESCTWVHRRHERRIRADGSRVGLIEGDCDREVDLGWPGLPPQRIRSRKLQLMFPDDTGTSIVTASYPADQASRWEPLIEATIAKARGIATRVPPPPLSTRAAWAGAGALVGLLATALITHRSSKRPDRPERGGDERRGAAKAKDAKKKDEEDDEEDEE
jgi:hypothetical protein